MYLGNILGQNNTKAYKYGVGNKYSVQKCPKFIF